MSDYLYLFLPIYFPILLGFLVKVLGYFPVDAVYDLNSFCLRITTPILMFTSMAILDVNMLSQVLSVILSLPLYTGILWSFAVIVTRVKHFRKRRIECIFVIILGNIGYFGWAVADVIFGEDALTRSLMFAILFWPVTILFAIVTSLFTGNSEGERESVLSTIKISFPIIGGFLAGLSFALLGLRVPSVLMSTLISFSNMTTTLILFGVGLSLSFKGEWGELMIILPLRLALGFGAAWLTTILIGGLDDLSRLVIRISSMMPVAANSLIMGEMMGLDKSFLARAVTMSTIFALVTIPMTLILVT